MAKLCKREGALFAHSRLDARDCAEEEDAESPAPEVRHFSAMSRDHDHLTCVSMSLGAFPLSWG